MLTETKLRRIQQEIETRYPPPYPTHLVTSLTGLKYLGKCFPQFNSAIINSITDRLQQVTLCGLIVRYGVDLEDEECLYFCYFIQSVSVPFFLYKLRISGLEKEDEKEFKVIVTGRRIGKTASTTVQSLYETKKRLQSYDAKYGRSSLESLFEKKYIASGFDFAYPEPNNNPMIWIDEAKDISNAVINKPKKIRKKVEVEPLHHDRLIRLDEE